MSAAKILATLRTLYPNTRYYLNFSSPLELLVAAILSAQVRDTVVNATTPKLVQKYKTAADYAQATLPFGSWRITLRRKWIPFSSPSLVVMRLSSCSTDNVPS